jgi:hypothetical protein
MVDKRYGRSSGREKGRKPEVRNSGASSSLKERKWMRDKSAPRAARRGSWAVEASV